MGRLAGYRYRDVIRRLKELGLRFHRQAAGSHEIWFNESLRCYTTIPNHPGDMPEGTLRAVLRQAGVEVNRFLDEEPEKQDDAAAQ
jgi:predicted RNA binding protein YcfA (HicA-like mRNA interferase family)